ncbi:GNAT family N-acetyltransferase [Actinomadura kijaniata]|uniref:GNAT family N-acetyltransferase n=1 Tax=Actinomadura kijaniata TaxID=46161 RepID=UPI000ACCDBFC|nr:GNAT family N-acetyltransferase [Actinomadura kijaniata]
MLAAEGSASLCRMDVRLEPWSESALALLRRTNLGGPESEDELLARHRRYLAMPEAGLGRAFVVRLGDETVGSINYHRRDWQGEEIYETGWNVLPPYRGRGVAAAAGTALIDIVREAAHAPGAPRRLHAFSSVDNAPSNALCRRLGFTLVGVCDFEYPRGSGRLIRSNDWRLDLDGPFRPGQNPGWA